MAMASMSSLSSSMDESHSEEEFHLFKTQLNKVQDIVEEYSKKSMYLYFVYLMVI